uniref:Ribonuclease H n=1 Tax=Petromyzon marinus TaxID=7757 RepID=A0AAJ7T4W5_PETMA|nr:ribonuclease H1-like isoform X3 [Petromyzon marinus]
MLRTLRGLLLLVRAERRGYYAVRIGRSPGLYATWDECRTQVEGFPGADFRKFLCEGTAHAYLAQGRGGDGAATERPPQLRRRWEDEEQPADRGDQPRFTYVGGVPVVFTDGCCISNGRQAARAGLGVFWGTNNPLNLSERLVGRQTNQRAEIMGWAPGCTRGSAVAGAKARARWWLTGPTSPCSTTCAATWTSPGCMCRATLETWEMSTQTNWPRREQTRSPSQEPSHPQIRSQLPWILQTWASPAPRVKGLTQKMWTVPHKQTWLPRWTLQSQRKFAKRTSKSQ